MANVDTIKAITRNLKTVLQNMGIKFALETIEEESKIPANQIPFGQIFYNTEEFEYTHGQKPEYAEVNFIVRVVLKKNNPTDLMAEQQKWIHLIRDGVTINALNIGDLSASLLVSRVTTREPDIDTQSDTSFVNYDMKIRYREL